MRDTTIATILILGLVASLRAQSMATRDEAPLARVGDRAFSAREVDERWRADSPTEQAQLLQSVYDGRRAALDALVADFLLDRAAAAKGVSREQFESDEVDSRARPVTDEDVSALLRANRRETQGRSLEETTALLREFLQERNRTAALAELVAELKSKEPELRVMLAPPRRPMSVEPDDPFQGPADAPVTVVEFADFECPFCRELAPTLRQLRDKYGDRIRLVWKHFPLTRIHPQAFQSAEAAQCAHEQGKFWEYHDKLFSNQPRLRAPSLKEYARDVGLDGTRFNACLDSSKYAERVGDALSEAARLGLSSTPSVFLNGRIVTGAKAYDVFAVIVEEELQSGKP